MGLGNLEAPEAFMFTLILTTVVLAVLYSLAWHDQPAKERDNSRRK